VAIKSGKLNTDLIREIDQKVKKKMKVKKKRWKAFDIFTERLEMLIIRYLNKTGIWRNTWMVEAISEDG
jgi:hypothetical protein